MDKDSKCPRESTGDLDKLNQSLPSASDSSSAGRVVNLRDWHNRIPTSACVTRARINDQNPPVSPNGVSEANALIGVDREWLAKVSEDPRHGQPPSVAELARRFVEGLLRRTRKDHYKNLQPLRDFSDRYRETISVDRRHFFEALIRILKSRLQFAHCNVRLDGHVADFSVEMTGTRLLFVALECDILGQVVFPHDSRFFTRRDELKTFSDDELLALVASFNDMDQPWILFAALAIVAERNLPVRFSTAPI